MEQKQLNITVPTEIANGTYSNLAVITHGKAEFIMDFAASMPFAPGPKVVSRVVMTPESAKRLAAALTENLEKYESRFGKIDLGAGTYAVPAGGCNA